uniref:2-amino-3-ketobutyrate coenzyme A ligase n=1 Tax=candidate division WOR-3 bacterium TaxID=2052148 RepID=A0A7C4CBN8_UNCW3
MAYGKMKEFLQKELATVREQGLYKQERYIFGPQGADISVEFPAGDPQKKVVNFCANNYLGLSSHPETLKAAHAALDVWGYGMSSVRFICGTQDLHRQLERKAAEFLGMEDAILYSSCFDANGGLFEVLLGADDAIVTDQLNHASIIDGIRLCKVPRERRMIYAHADMADLEAKLKQVRDGGARFVMIATDGAFSMDGDVAKLPEICDLAEKYDALVMVDDSHATGFMGKHGRGTHEHHNVMGRVDIITTTFGKAMGGASGGVTASRREIVEILRQRSRPYLFSNSLCPAVAAATLRVIEILQATTERRDKLERNTAYFRKAMTDAGFDIKPGVHPIVPIMLYNAKLAQDFARDLYFEGIYVIGFFYPVVPRGQARIRVQLSAGHEQHHLEQAVAAFTKVGKKYEVLHKTKAEIVARYGE